MKLISFSSVIYMYIYETPVIILFIVDYDSAKSED